MKKVNAAQPGLNYANVFLRYIEQQAINKMMKKYQYNENLYN